MDLIIGQIYIFDYTSSSKSTSKREKIKAVMNEDTQKKLRTYIKENKIKTLNRFQEKCKFADEIKNTKDSVLKDAAKKEFREKFSNSKKDTPDYIRAQNLFFRAYKPENMDIHEDGGVQAIFAGWDCTITGKLTYKWYVLSETTIDKKYYTEELNSFIEIK